MKPKLLIVIERGMIQSIASTLPLNIVINDYDNEEDDQVYEYNLDAIFKEGEAFKLVEKENKGFPLAPSEVLLKEYLKDIKF